MRSNRFEVIYENPLEESKESKESMMIEKLSNKDIQIQFDEDRCSK